jgi:hypothetical protein
MEQQNPISSNGDASTPDPIDRIEAFLAASDGDSTGQSNAPADGKPADAANPTDKPSGGDEGKGQEPQFTTAHLAQFLGVDESMVDVDEAGQPVFKTKVDGKESTAKFQDFLKDYQLKGHAENKAREAAEKIQAAERQMQEAQQAIAQRWQHAEQQMQSLAELAQVQQQELSADYNAIDWNTLWQTDPGRAGILRDQFQAKAARINGTLQNIGQRRQALQQQTMEQQKQQAQRALATEAARVIEAIPEWKDSAVANKESSEIRNWAMQRGYAPAYLEAVSQGLVPGAALIVQDLRRAWQHETLQKTKPAIENQVRTAPKLVKPGQAPSQSADSSATLKALKQNVKQSSGGNSAKAVADWLIAAGKA